MPIEINNHELQRAAGRLQSAAAGIRSTHDTVGPLLGSAGLHTERDLVRLRLGSAHSLIEGLAADHDARAALAATLESLDWTSALLSGRIPGRPTMSSVARSDDHGAAASPTLVIEPAPPFMPPRVYTAETYRPYDHLSAGTEVLAAPSATGTCAAHHAGEGAIVGPDGRVYPLAYPEFALDDGTIAHLGPAGQRVGGRWRTVSIATGVSSTAAEHRVLSFLAGAVTMRPPTAMPINPDDYAVLQVDQNGAAWVPAEPIAPGYGPGDIPEAIDLDTLAAGSDQQPPPTSVTAMDATALVVGSIAAGLATSDYVRNRATRAYVVLFEQAQDGRLRARFIEHQVWVLDDSRMEVRSAGLSVHADGVSRTALATAPFGAVTDAVSVSVPDPNHPGPRGS